MFHGLGQGLSAVGAEQHGGAYQGAGLVDVHELEFADGQLLPDGREVNRLSAGHAARTRSRRQEIEHVELPRRCYSRKVLRQRVERLGLQGIANQQCGRFIEFDVAGGFAATQDIVIHAGQVVMDQRIGVDQLDSDGRNIEHAAVGAENCAGGMAQQRAHALAAAEHRIPHCVVQATGRKLGRGQGGLQGGLGALLDASHPSREIHDGLCILFAATARAVARGGGIEFAQTVGIEDANLLFRRAQGCLALAQQRHTALVCIQCILQGHFPGLHGRDDTLQLGQSGFECGGCRACWIGVRNGVRICGHE